MKEILAMILYCLFVIIIFYIAKPKEEKNGKANKKETAYKS